LEGLRATIRGVAVRRRSGCALQQPGRHRGEEGRGEPREQPEKKPDNVSNSHGASIGASRWKPLQFNCRQAFRFRIAAVRRPVPAQALPGQPRRSTCAVAAARCRTCAMCCGGGNAALNQASYSWEHCVATALAQASASISSTKRDSARPPMLDTCELLGLGPFSVDQGNRVAVAARFDDDRRLTSATSIQFKIADEEIAQFQGTSIVGSMIYPGEEFGCATWCALPPIRVHHLAASYAAIAFENRKPLPSWQPRVLKRAR
jgi:hypothetical protein